MIVKKVLWSATAMFVLLMLITSGCSSGDDEATDQDGMTSVCYSEPEVLTTDDGIEFVRTPDACFEDLPDWPYEPQYLEIDGLRQAYVDEGPADGEVVLLLHGQPSWSYLYRKMIPVLAEEGYRVIAMDHLGFGRSDKPIDWEYYTYEDHVYRLGTFIHELGLEQGDLTLFAQDWGSLIGLYVVGTHPDWFDRVVIGNGFLPTFAEGSVPAPLPDNPTLTREFFHRVITAIPAQQPPFYNDEGELVMSLPEAAGIGQEISSDVGLAEGEIGGDFGIWIDYSRNDERFRPEQIVEALTYFDLSPAEEAAYAAPFPTRITMGGARAFPGLVNQMPGLTQDAWESLGEFEKPFLTIWGGNDPGNLGQPTTQQVLLDHVPGTAGWDHVRLPEASHFLQDDQGEEIAGRIIEFIEATKHDPSAADTDEVSKQVGFEISEIQSPNSIRAWISFDITQEELGALELYAG